MIFVQHCDAKGEPFEEGSSAFENTDLQAKLDALGAQTLVVCACRATSASATPASLPWSLGYGVRLASDGHSTWDSNGETARSLSG